MEELQLLPWCMVSLAELLFGQRINIDQLQIDHYLTIIGHIWTDSVTQTRHKKININLSMMSDIK